MASIFSRIIAGEIRHIRCWRMIVFAFLDIMPLAPVIPWWCQRKEVDYLFDLEEDLLCRNPAFSRRIAAALEQVFHL